MQKDLTFTDAIKLCHKHEQVTTKMVSQTASVSLEYVRKEQKSCYYVKPGRKRICPSFRTSVPPADCHTTDQSAPLKARNVLAVVKLTTFDPSVEAQEEKLQTNCTIRSDLPRPGTTMILPVSRLRPNSRYTALDSSIGQNDLEDE